MFLIWIGVIWGSVADSKYMKAGGKKTSTVELILWAVIPVVFVVYILFSIFIAAPGPGQIDSGKMANALGEMLVTTFPAYFGLYEARRWYVRWKNPAKIEPSVSVK